MSKKTIWTPQENFSEDPVLLNLLSDKNIRWLQLALAAMIRDTLGIKIDNQDAIKISTAIKNAYYNNIEEKNRIEHDVRTTNVKAFFQKEYVLINRGMIPKKIDTEFLSKVNREALREMYKQSRNHILFLSDHIKKGSMPYDFMVTKMIQRPGKFVNPVSERDSILYDGDFLRSKHPLIDNRFV